MQHMGNIFWQKRSSCKKTMTTKLNIKLCAHQQRCVRHHRVEQHARLFTTVCPRWPIERFVANTGHIG